MPLLEATKINLLKSEKSCLESISNSRSLPAGIVIRANIILFASNRIANNEIAKVLGITNKTVKLWRNRWAESSDELNKLIKEKDIYSNIINILKDKERPGCPARITAEQKARILSLACENPKNYGLPLSHWTIKELLNEIKKQKIVEQISWTRVQNFLKYGGFKTT
jgi:transposase